MRYLPVIREILRSSQNMYVGENKPHGRVTVEPDWKLNMTLQKYGPLTGGPYRWWRRKDNAHVEVEVPNIDTISINRSLDQEAATCTIVMSNIEMHANNEEPGINQTQGLAAFLKTEIDVGERGYYGYNYGRGDSDRLWGQGDPDVQAGPGHFLPNAWSQVLVPNALLRTYQGYGGFTEDANGNLVAADIDTAVASGHLVLSGVWLIDTVSLGTNGKIRLQCRDMAKLLIEQMIYPPLVPRRYYPPSWSRYDYIPTPDAPDESPSVEPGPVRLQYNDSSTARWLGYDGGNKLVSQADLPFRKANDETKISMGHGWHQGNQLYSKDWWECLAFDAYINRVYVCPAGAPPGGSYTVYISIYEDDEGVSGYPEGWQAWVSGPTQPGGVIPYDGDDPGSNIKIYHPDKPSLNTGIPYVKKVSVQATASINRDDKDGTWITLPRTYKARKIRITMESKWKSPWGPNNYRSALASVKARLVLRDPSTDAPDASTKEQTIQVDGNLKDWVDPVKELLMWSGFLLWEGPNANQNPGKGQKPGVYGVIEHSKTYPVEPLGEDLFDKKSVMDAILSIKEVLGYIFYIDEEGAVHFHSPNWWQAGNTNHYDGKRFKPPYIPDIWDWNSLTDFTSNYTDSAVRSEIIIGSDLEDSDAGETQYVTFNPRSVMPSGAPDLVRGMVTPAAWINEVWMDKDEQTIMAALIALHSMFNSRQGSVTIVANPELQINDQVRIFERTTSESWIHYIRGISSEMNLETGEYTMTLSTNWLGEFDNWAFDRNTLIQLAQRRNPLSKNNEKSSLR